MGRPSIGANVFFNYLGQGYVILIGIVVLPLYLKYLGAEAYGLVGFFTLLASWLQFLDLGMTPTLGREIARLKEKPHEHWRLLTVVNSLERVFFLIAALSGISLFVFKGRIAADWLTFSELNPTTVSTAIGVMAGNAGSRRAAHAPEPGRCLRSRDATARGVAAEPPCA